MSAEFEVDPTVAKFLGKANILLIDSATACRDAIGKYLVEMGAEAKNIVSMANLKKAPMIIKQMQPHIIVTEYQIHDFFGLNLLPYIEEHYSKPENRIFVLVTNTSSQVSVAEAAEEEVDAYIVKPFLKDQVKRYLQAAIKNKIKPTEYVSKLREGKRLLDKNELTSAKMAFMEALDHSPQPCLAFYYMGQTEVIAGEHESAIETFDLGLNHNEIHYKCLVGKFESLDSQKKVEEAYAVVKKITANYPITPQRLGRMFYLAVYTHNFEDVETYFDLYTALDRKPPELKKVVSAGTMACAKFVLKQGDKMRSASLFEKSIYASGRNLQTIEAIIDYLLVNKKSKMAASVLELFPQDKKMEPIFKQLDFRIMSRQLPNTKIAQVGKKLVEDGLADARVFEILVEVLLKDGHDRFAENMIYEGIKRFPELKEKFKDLAA